MNSTTSVTVVPSGNNIPHKKTMKTKDDGENSCVILYNISDKEQTLELNLNENGLRLCAELETGSEKVHVSENKIEIPAWGIAVIK